MSAHFCTFRHPQYKNLTSDWLEWREVYEGGSCYINKYLEKYSDRESTIEFNKRKKISYIPTHAKSAVNEVKNSIFQRIVDVRRIGGPENYQSAVLGSNDGLGVDKEGNTMNSYIGRVIIPELLVVARVGIFVDKAGVEEGATLSDTRGLSPYVYHYKAEDILSWTYDEETRRLKSLLLRDYEDDVDFESGLTMGQLERYRYCRVVDGRVEISWYQKVPVSPNSQKQEYLQSGETITIDIPEIPFAFATLTNSLLADVSSYQKAIMNVASSDVGFLLQANMPFYTEQYDAQAEMSQLIRGQLSADGTTDGSESQASKSGSTQQLTGHTQGRRYGKNLERPGFVHPSSEPLLASMKKQEQMKQEIKELINLNVKALQPSRESAASKKEDSKSLEAGLSYIGLELQYAENEVARFWAMYENSEPARVTYPERYTLRSEEDLRKEASDYEELAQKSPSLTYQKEVQKHVAGLTLGTKVSVDTLDKIRKEIDDATIAISDPEVIRDDVEAGLLSREAAAKARNYPDGDIETANQEHAERAKRIAEAQASVRNRGVTDMSAEGSSAGTLDKEGANDSTNSQ